MFRKTPDEFRKTPDEFKVAPAPGWGDMAARMSGKTQLFSIILAAISRKRPYSKMHGAVEVTTL